MSCPGGSSFSGPQRILSVVGKVGSVQFMVGFQAGSMGRADRGSQPGLGFPYRCGDQSGQAGASCTRKDCIDPATPHQQQPVPATFVNGVNLRARSKPKTGAGSLAVLSVRLSALAVCKPASLQQRVEDSKAEWMAVACLQSVSPRD